MTSQRHRPRRGTSRSIFSYASSSFRSRIRGSPTLFGWCYSIAFLPPVWKGAKCNRPSASLRGRLRHGDTEKKKSTADFADSHRFDFEVLIETDAPLLRENLWPIPTDRTIVAQSYAGRQCGMSGPQDDKCHAGQGQRGKTTTKTPRHREEGNQPRISRIARI